MIRLLNPEWLSFCLMTLLVAGCGLLGDEEEEEEVSRTAPRLVGRVASVHEKEGFALVEGFSDLVLGDGLLLTTHGDDGRLGTLVVTGERARRYAAADIKSGDIAKGDAVYARPVEGEAEPSSTPVTPSGLPGQL